MASSCGNVFDDLSVPNAANEATKMDLAVAINDAIEARGLRQVDAARLIGATQPQLSALQNYRLSGFSVGRRVDFLAAAGRDVEIVFRPRDDGSAGSVRVRQFEDVTWRLSHRSPYAADASVAGSNPPYASPFNTSALA
jgi:predicted XRE-type DNA-binding protein